MKKIHSSSKLVCFVLLLSVIVVSSSPISSVSNQNYTDDQLLDLVQTDVLRYFWDYADASTKLALERYHQDQPKAGLGCVTTGGSGFGILTIIASIDRGLVNRAEAVTRFQTMLNFLQYKAYRFHGAWSHWINPTTGQVIPFSPQDDGADLVETAYLCEGLIVLREYFKNGNDVEKALSQQADQLWRGVEWDWFTQGGQNRLVWHWSPKYGWAINMTIGGYNEALISYVLAASSPTHNISASVYQQGWARNGGISSKGTSYGLPLIFNYGGSGTVGPLFFSQYSYLGLDPRGLSDKYANYTAATQNHAKIQYNYCVANPLNWTGYSAKCWGLTASYSYDAKKNQTTYDIQSPSHDTGVITPTAALSSFPYTPNESMAFLRYLYEEKRAQYVGVAGPYDAFSPQYNWVTPRYLAIDQGTISPMIENYRSGLLWKLFMNAGEVKQGLVKLGFNSTRYNF